MLKNIHILFSDMVFRFFILGIAIFTIDSVLFTNENPKNIIINERNIYSYLNDKFELHEKKQADNYLHQLSESEKKSLINSFIDEQLLYQFALSNQLEKSDGQIKSFISEKGQELLKIVANGQVSPVSEEEVEQYYHQNFNRYASEARYNFEVRHYPLSSSAIAQQEKIALNKGGHVPLQRHEGIDLPFIEYNQTHDRLNQRYSEGFVNQLQKRKLEPTQTWFGPIKGKNSLHLVKLTAYTPKKITTLDAVSAPIRQELLLQKQQLSYQQQLAHLRQSSTIQQPFNIME
ncbi:peptidyl-prolyl cis-trans isomerase [Photobacterium minamisatsumaniensis]|uniref:peptidyl-prolyl cis-trans isomerase n=1 Tax=Photobacterium minamisatsumaniensis TaxID=2910233 RepID=UPI003D12DCE4